MFWKPTILRKLFTLHVNTVYVGIMWHLLVFHFLPSVLLQQQMEAIINLYVVKYRYETAEGSRAKQFHHAVVAILLGTSNVTIHLSFCNFNYNNKNIRHSTQNL